MQEPTAPEGMVEPASLESMKTHPDVELTDWHFLQHEPIAFRVKSVLQSIGGEQSFCEAVDRNLHTATGGSARRKRRRLTSASHY
jgi:hypothetical protein